MVISSADSSGKPWVSPVGFAYDDNFNFYWISNKAALHSKNISIRPEVAIVIFGKMPEGDFDGVYIDAKAYELVDELEIKSTIDLFNATRPQSSKFSANSIEDVTGEAAWRMYKAKPIEFSKRADDTVNGQAITIRKKVQL